MNAIQQISTAWSPVGGAWTRDLPACNVDDFVSRAGGGILLAAEVHEGSVLHNLSTRVRQVYDSLGAAMAAGDKMAEDALAFRNRYMAESLGLKPDEWTFRCQDRFVWFEAGSDPQTRIERYASDRWASIVNGQLAGYSATALRAASLCTPRGVVVKFG